MVATVLWAALLILGLIGVATDHEHKPLRLALGLSLLGQIALHLLYGSETFLYACHYGPLLVLAAAWSVRTRLRRLALVLALAAVPLVALNNARQLHGAITLLRDDGSLPASRATDAPASPSRATIGQQFCQSEPP